MPWGRALGIDNWAGFFQDGSMRSDPLWEEARTSPPKSSQTGGHLDMLDAQA
jgi:hypothetical protein